MQFEEMFIIKQKLSQAIQRIAYLQESIIAKDKTIQILQDRIDYMRQSHRLYQSPKQSPYHHSGKSYDSIEKADSEDTIRQFLQVQLCDSGNFDNTLDENKVGERPALKIPEFQKIPFFDHSSSFFGSISPDRKINEFQGSMSARGYSSLDNFSSLRNDEEQISFFKSFMIIGSDKLKPLVMFRYPFRYQCEETILDLIYPSVLLKPIGKTKGYNDLMRTASCTIKDKFIIPLKRPQQLLKEKNNKSKSDQYQYLIGFEVDDIFKTEEDVSTHPIFYCFLSDHKCINLFYQLINLIINSVNAMKSQLALSKSVNNSVQLLENGLLKAAIQHSQLQTLLSRIHRNKFQYNQHLRIKLSKDQVFTQEIPPKENESDFIFLNSLSISMSTLKVACKFSNSNITFECNMILLMLVYFSCQKRIVIYSTNKEKVSMCMMLLLELIKPLQFVNPIIQGQFKEQYLEFIDAPMAMLIGLWGERKISKKIDLSYKKLAHTSQSMWRDEFEKQKIMIKDGLIFNLDTEKVYGQSDPPLNNVVTYFCKELKKYSTGNHYKRIQSLFQMVMDFDLKTDWAILLRNRVEATQMYSYHKEQY